MQIAVIDYGIGNLRSAQKALQYVGADAHLTSDHDQIAQAQAVVLPGVGHYGSCMQALRTKKLDEIALRMIEEGKPFLGICVGMQMLFSASEEAPNVKGLGVFDGVVERLSPDVKAPQMQWNLLRATETAERWPIMATLEDQWAYFVHSFAVRSTSHALATCEYGGQLIGVVGHKNVIATQFHPEKSGEVGLGFLRAWCEQALAGTHSAN